ncbi:MAG: MFS transporter, partial [Chloroflexi bacterium]|nr:MFS transporter [Chloroflexota bacterium]
MKLNLVANLGRAASPISILRERNFGLVWSAITLAGMASQMETVVVVWYVLNLTDSPFLVGLTASARMGFNFLALFAGATADIVPRRVLLVIVQVLLASLAVLMLTLIFTGRIEVWHIFIITLAAGLVRIFQMPAAQSLAVDSVSQDRIPNAVALVNAGMNLALVAGPLLGGILFELAGPEGAYVLVAALYCLSGLSALMMGAIRVSSAGDRESVFTAVVQGLRYVKAQQLLWSVLVVAVIINITGFSFHTTLMPIFARDVLDRDSVGLGLLISFFGIGALVGSMIWASIPNLRHTGLLCILAVVGW